jgi:Family of unknown function (DUF6090)
MIKFFRHIRQNLLLENKTSKYFKYAIGEIVLVVIGILIAFQINNWNELRKNGKKERYVLEQLEMEFVKDSTILSRFIFLTHAKMNHAKKLRAAIEQRRYNIGLDTVLRYGFFNGRLVLFDAFMPTFDEILASGNLSILRDEELKKQIKSYKSVNEGVKSFLYEGSQKLKDEYNRHLYKYFESEIMTYLWENAPKRTISMDSLKIFRTNVHGFFDDPETIYHVNNGIGVDRELHWQYKERVMPSIESILTEIRKALKQKQ